MEDGKRNELEMHAQRKMVVGRHEEESLRERKYEKTGLLNG